MRTIKLFLDFLFSSKFARGQNVEKLFSLERLLHSVQKFGTSHQIKKKTFIHKYWYKLNLTHLVTYTRGERVIVLSFKGLTNVYFIQACIQYEMVDNQGA